MAAVPDISVILPLIYGAHVHCVAAVAWLDTVQNDGELILCRANQQGVLRLLNNPVVMGNDVRNGIQAWETWDALLADRRFHFADEPAGLEAEFRILTTALTHQPKRWQDAYLAAFAMAADAELVTFDTGFASFPGLRVRILSP